MSNPNYNTSPNMGLLVPIPSTDPGPEWAQLLYNALYTTLDSHDHTPGNGVPITPSAININQDLTFNNTFSVTSVKSVEFFNQSATLTSTGSIYELGGDLYWNNSTGTPVQVTKGGNVNVGNGNIGGLPSTPSGGAGITWLNSQDTFQFSQDNGTGGANVEIGSSVIRVPVSQPTPSGNYILLSAPSSLSGGYQLTLPPQVAPAANTFVLMDTSGTLTANVNIDASAFQISAFTLELRNGGLATAYYADKSVTFPKRASRPVSSTGTDPGLGGYSRSTALSTTLTLNSSPQAITNNCTLTTGGGAVQIRLTSAPGNTTTSILSNTQNVIFTILETTTNTVIAGCEVELVLGQLLGIPVLVGVHAPAAGTYTYKVQASGGGNFTGNTLCIDAYEL